MLWQTFLLYAATWFLVALTPGPAVMFCIARTTRYGLRSSLAGIAGIQAGNFLFFIAISLGLAALLATATTAFTVFRIAGVIYLFYLGIRIILRSFQEAPGGGAAAAPAAGCKRSLFVQGALIQISNPKALLFVSALLPQFVDTDGPLLLQLFILGTATVIIDAAVLLSYGLLAERGLRRLRALGVSKWLERTFGAALIFFGFRLLSPGSK